ncbi:YdcF family protein [Novosphingobium sp.]|uniref:YdcF family protein n=1 Tax=Novosphingobium sp. TaxID=1874826 RepID=UPI003B522E50
MRRIKPAGLIRRLFSLVLLAWILGFLWFALFLPRPAGDTHTDGAIALTGGPGRIARGLSVLRAGQAERLLIAGVDSEVTPSHFDTEYGVTSAQRACCVTLGYESFDTRSNAREASDWVAHNDIHSVRLITTDWHMRRAAFDLRVAARTYLIPGRLIIIEDAVPSHPSMKALFVEYNKFLARIAAWLVNWPDAPRPPHTRSSGSGHAF